MEKILIALVTSLVIPLAGAVLQRHHAERPDEWERVFGWAVFTVAALGGVVLCANLGLRFRAPDDPDETTIDALGRTVSDIAILWLLVVVVVGAALTWGAFRTAWKRPGPPPREPG